MKSSKKIKAFEVKIKVIASELDLAIKKANQLKATLEEVEQLISSLGNATVINNS